MIMRQNGIMKLGQRTDGSTLVEYAVMLCVLVMGMLLSIQIVGTNTSSSFNALSKQADNTQGISIQSSLLESEMASSPATVSMNGDSPPLKATLDSPPTNK